MQVALNDLPATEGSTQDSNSSSIATFLKSTIFVSGSNITCSSIQKMRALDGFNKLKTLELLPHFILL